MTQTRENNEMQNGLSTQKLLRTLIAEGLMMELSLLSERLSSNRAPLIALNGDAEGAFNTNQIKN